MQQIKHFPEILLSGKKMRMSLAGNKTKELWQNFMPQRNAIKNMVNTDLYSVEIYDDTSFFETFNPAGEFEKWAAVPVKSFDTVADGMETLLIPAGLYAVFQYKGKASEAMEMYRYIYGTWLPASEYVLDNRPHFALMREKYKGDHPDSEEEIRIPVKLKT